jgi:hypothetical protein
VVASGEDLTMDQYSTSEEAVLRLWAEFSRHTKTVDERALAQGQPIVDELRGFPEAVLRSAALSASRRGEDLLWAAWRDRAIEENERRIRNKFRRSDNARRLRSPLEECQGFGATTPGETRHHGRRVGGA